MSYIAGAAQLTFSTISVTSRSQVTSTSLARVSMFGAALPDETSMPAQSSRAQSSARDIYTDVQDHVNCMVSTKLHQPMSAKTYAWPGSIRSNPQWHACFVHGSGAGQDDLFSQSSKQPYVIVSAPIPDLMSCIRKISIDVVPDDEAMHS